MKKLLAASFAVLFSLSSAFAQVPGMFQPLLTAPLTPLSVTFTDSDAQQTPSTTFTFTGKSIGTAASNRFVIVGVTVVGGAAGNVSSMTIGGISATQIVSINSGSANYLYAIWRAAVPTGTTANVVINYGSSVNRTAIGVWAVYGGTGTAYATSNDAGNNPTTLSLNVPYGGVAIGVSGATGGSVTWSGMTERYDTSAGFTNVYTGADATVANGATPRAVTVTRTVTLNAFDGGVAASFGP